MAGYQRTMDKGEWGWPEDPGQLETLQRELATAADVATPWGAPHDEGAPDACGVATPTAGIDFATVDDLGVAAAFAAFPRGEGGPGRAGQPVVAAAVMWRGGRGGRVVGGSVVQGESGGAYVAGLLALRCGALLEAAVLGLGQRPDVLLVDATGRDHPRRAGLALHLGARLGLPSVGVTNRVLLAAFDEPDDVRGSWSPLRLDGELVGYAVRTRSGARPVLAHAAWRTTPEQARDLVLTLSGRWRTPLPLRAARTLARRARAEREAGGAEG